MYSAYYIMAFFLIYAFLGWVLEVAFHVVTMGQFINRGFLNGPLCPIYGIGMVGIITLLEPLSGNTFLLFIGGTIFATTVELIGGFILYKLFHLRWWDYSKEPFNLGGFICLRFSIAWGLCIVFVMKLIQPVIGLNVYILDNLLGHILIIVLYVYLFADVVCTVLSIMHLNKNLKRLSAMAADVRRASDGLTEQIGKKTMNMEIRVQESRVQAALAKAENREYAEEKNEELKRKGAELKKAMHDFALKHPRLQRFFGFGRLYRAFPNLRHIEYNDELQAVIESLTAGKAFVDTLIFDKNKKGVD
ncbi:MAG: hypothetical protein MJ117_09205 [Lachnospiraceae bacterium]|nr:hypothetical protein [Lachnospiraceae bacterium]